MAKQKPEIPPLKAPWIAPEEPETCAPQPPWRAPGEPEFPAPGRWYKTLDPSDLPLMDRDARKRGRVTYPADYPPLQCAPDRWREAAWITDRMDPETREERLSERPWAIPRAQGCLATWLSGPTLRLGQQVGDPGERGAERDVSVLACCISHALLDLVWQLGPIPILELPEPLWALELMTTDARKRYPCTSALSRLIRWEALGEWRPRKSNVDGTRWLHFGGQEIPRRAGGDPTELGRARQWVHEQLYDGEPKLLKVLCRHGAAKGWHRANIYKAVLQLRASRYDEGVYGGVIVQYSDTRRAANERWLAKGRGFEDDGSGK